MKMNIWLLKALIVTAILAFGNLVSGQTKITGTVFDSETNLPIEGVHISIPGKTIRIKSIALSRIPYSIPDILIRTILFPLNDIGLTKIMIVDPLDRRIASSLNPICNIYFSKKN